MRLRRFCPVLPVVVLIGWLIPLPLLAQSSLGVFQHWRAERALVDGQQVCFIWSFPITRGHDGRPRGITQFLLTHWSEAEWYNDAVIYAGYNHQIGSQVQVSIGESSFTFITSGGWSHVRSQDSTSFTQAFRQGQQMVVDGLSDRGTHTTDTYSLQGSARALETIDRACGARQSEPELTTLGIFEYWQAEIGEVEGQTSCFIWSNPLAREPGGWLPESAQFVVAHWPELDRYNQIGVYAGYVYQDGSEVLVTIGDQTFTFTTGGRWAHASPQDTHELIQALRRGRQMTVEGVSKLGTRTIDTYSLLGSTRAMEIIDQGCDPSEDEIPTHPTAR